MMDKAPTSVQTYASPFMITVSVVLLIAVGLYFLFMAINNLGLVDQQGNAMVIGKEYREASTTYSTQKIGNRMQTVPQTTPEMYILKLDINGKTTECAVDREVYNGLHAGDHVKAIYQRKRITGALQVLNVSRQR